MILNLEGYSQHLGLILGVKEALSGPSVAVIQAWCDWQMAGRTVTIFFSCSQWAWHIVILSFIVT